MYLGTDLVIEKDDNLWINTASIHQNPKYYDKPLEFNPEHFTRENKANRNPYAYLPFGQGPRGCIGMRFALLEAKYALASIVRKFNLLPSEKTVEPVKADPEAAITYAKNGLYARVESRS